MTKIKRISRSDHKIIAGARFRAKHGTFFSLSFGTLSAQHNDAIKITCVVSKKTVARAVDRNLVKRKCRAAARDCLAGVIGPQAFVFYAKHSARGAPYSAIKGDVKHLIAQALAAQK